MATPEELRRQQEENELLLISQGICECDTPSSTIEEVTNWNPYFNLDDELIDRNEGMLSYTKINATFITDGSLPEYTKFKISRR